jgi:hypothetical protein
MYDTGAGNRKRFLVLALCSVIVIVGWAGLSRAELTNGRGCAEPIWAGLGWADRYHRYRGLGWAEPG